MTAAPPAVEAATTVTRRRVATPHGGGRVPPVLAWGPVLAVAAVKVGLNLVAAGRYGWHRDELYYADAGRHLALGYVDFPSVTPALARLAEVLFGPSSLVGLRLVASLAGAATVVVTAAVTRELGGGRRAQVLATVAITPLLVGANAMFQTVSFDQLGWGLVIWAAAALLVRPGGPTTRAWLLLGAAAALAWSTKYTVGMLFACLAVGWLATRTGRATLRGRGPVLAVGVLVASALPNLWWQAVHGWPSVAFFAGRNGEVRGEYQPHLFWGELVLMTGVVAVPLVVAGLRALCRDVTTRPLGVALVLVAPLWLLAGGKGYYAAPLLIGALPAGAVAWERRLAAGSDAEAARRGWRYPALIAGTALLAAPLVAPFLPTATMVDLGLDQLRDDYAEEIGWPELAATVDAEWAALPAPVRARTVVVASNYGVAGAIERFGAHDDLEVVSDHLQHRYWSPSDRAAAADHALLVGFGADAADALCATDPERVATVTNRWGVDNEEAGGPVWRCRLRRTAPPGDGHEGARGFGGRLGG